MVRRSGIDFVTDYRQVENQRNEQSAIAKSIIMKSVFPLYVMLAFLPASSFAQGWSVGLSFGAGASKSQTGCCLPPPGYLFSCSAGIIGSRDLDANLFGRIGLEYSRKSILVAIGIPDTRNAFDQKTGRLELSRIVYGDATEVYESITVPLSINYRVVPGYPIGVVASCGIDCGLLFRRRTIIEPTTTGRSEGTESEAGFIASFMIAAGLSCSVTKDVSVLLLPKFSYSLYPRMSFQYLNFYSAEVECTVLYRM
jgi:hypothetical protein